MTLKVSLSCRHFRCLRCYIIRSFRIGVGMRNTRGTIISLPCINYYVSVNQVYQHGFKYLRSVQLYTKCVDMVNSEI